MLRARIMGQLTESPRPLPIVVEVWRMWGRAEQRAQLVSNLEFPHFKLSLETRADQGRPVLTESYNYTFLLSLLSLLSHLTSPHSTCLSDSCGF